MNRQPDPDNLTSSHTPIIALQQEILGDAKFQKLYFDAYLPWDPQGGYEPRWYDGPQPENVRLLFLMAEPGAITKTEQQHLSPPITHNPWNAKRESYQQDNYWLKQLYQLCQLVWPEDTEANMDGSLGGSCTFWMSLPPGDQVRAIPLSVVNYFLETYLKRFLSQFPNAVILTASSNAIRNIPPDLISLAGEPGLGASRLPDHSGRYPG